MKMSSALKDKNIDFVCDTKDSFMHEYLPRFMADIKKLGYRVRFFTDYADLKKGDVAFFVSCHGILNKKQLELHAHNAIVHPSKLPEGRGSGVVSWQILEGASELWVTLFEATVSIDGGDIYYQAGEKLQGHELCDELRAIQAKLTFSLVERFLSDYPHVTPTKQIQMHRTHFYKRRTPRDSELDVDKTLREQFDLLRTADSKRYPAFFHLRGHTYILKIYENDVG